MITWIDEKAESFQVAGVGIDLPAVRVLQRRHEEIEQDISGFEEKVLSRFSIFCEQGPVVGPLGFQSFCSKCLVRLQK